MNKNQNWAEIMFQATGMSAPPGQEQPTFQAPQFQPMDQSQAMGFAKQVYGGHDMNALNAYQNELVKQLRAGQSTDPTAIWSQVAHGQKVAGAQAAYDQQMKEYEQQMQQQMTPYDSGHGGA